MPAPRRTVAVYGGSFDPPHNAHVLVAQHVRTLVDEVWIVPAYQHAFGKPLRDFGRRLAMCKLAFGALDGVTVLDVERALGGPSRMANTLRELAAQHPEIQLRLVIGSDLVQEFERWSDPALIRRIAPPLIVQREGHVERDATGPVFPAVSSTSIRDAVARGAPFAHLVPGPVAAYIAEHKLYVSPP